MKSVRIKYEPITIKDPCKIEKKAFKDTDEFTVYYREHEKEMKELSTKILNRTFKIPGYRIRITKKGTEQEELILVKDYYNRSTSTTTSNEKEVNERIEALEQEVKNIKNELNNMTTFLQQLNV